MVEAVGYLRALRGAKAAYVPERLAVERGAVELRVATRYVIRPSFQSGGRTTSEDAACGYGDMTGAASSRKPPTGL